MELLDFSADVAWVVANKKTSVVRNVGIHNLMCAAIVAVLDHIMAKEIASGDDPKLDVMLF